MRSGSMADQWKCRLCGFATDNDTKALQHRNEHCEKQAVPPESLELTEQDITFLRVQGIRWTDDEQ